MLVECHRTDHGRNSVDLCRACRVLRCSELVQYYILYNQYTHMVLIPLWTNTTITTYMLTLLYNITFLFIYIIMVFFFCSVVSEVYWLLFGPRPELHAPFSSVFWSAKLEVLSVKYFLRPPIFDNPRGSLRTWHSQFFGTDMVMHFYIQILVY